MRALDIKVGDSFNDWTVIDGPLIFGTRRKWSCRCVCGKIQLVTSSSLSGGHSPRCRSCSNREMALNREAQRKELSDIAYEQIGTTQEVYTKLRLAVNEAIYRCSNNSHHAYKNYGGRGIKVYQPWVDNRVLFIRYLLTLDGHDNPSLWLDRRDNDKGYEPGNLRFVTPSQSRVNQRRMT